MPKKKKNHSRSIVVFHLKSQNIGKLNRALKFIPSFHIYIYILSKHFNNLFNRHRHLDYKVYTSRIKVE